jgi:hypothetical protein
MQSRSRLNRVARLRQRIFYETSDWYRDRMYGHTGGILELRKRVDELLLEAMDEDRAAND